MKNKYPHLLDLINIIGQDNNMNVRDEFRWPDGHMNLPALEEMASRLSDEEKYIFSAHEVQEQIEVAQRHGVMELHRFLNEAFDGKFTDIFYY